MSTPGMVRKVDELGRIVIPHEIRRTLGIGSGDTLELCCREDGLLLRKFPAECVFCGGREDLFVYQEKHICGQCLRDLRKG